MQKPPYADRLMGKLGFTFEVNNSKQNTSSLQFIFATLEKKKVVLLWCAETANVVGGGLENPALFSHWKEKQEKSERKVVKKW